MSQDLFLTIAEPTGFAASACASFVERYGLRLEFPEGFSLDDQIGFLPCLVTRAGDPAAIETGFECDVLENTADSRCQLSLRVSAGAGAMEWALAHAVAAYFVAETGATLEDPQTDQEYQPTNISELDALVRELLDEATR